MVIETLRQGRQKFFGDSEWELKVPSNPGIDVSGRGISPKLNGKNYGSRDSESKIALTKTVKVTCGPFHRY